MSANALALEERTTGSTTELISAVGPFYFALRW